MIPNDNVPQAVQDEPPGAAVVPIGVAMRFPPFELVKWFSAAEGRFDISLSNSDCEPLSVSDLLDQHELAD